MGEARGVHGGRIACVGVWWPRVAPLVTSRTRRPDLADDRGVLHLIGSRQIGIREATGHRCAPLS